MSETSAFKHKAADESPGFLLWKVTSLWHEKLSAVLGEIGINQTQYAVMASLKWFEENSEPTTQTHLVHHSKIEKMTVSKTVRQLEARGLLRRSESTADRRAMVVRFTRRGYTVIERAIVAVESADDEFFSSLNPSQMAGFKAIARELCAGGS